MAGSSGSLFDDELLNGLCILPFMQIGGVTIKLIAHSDTDVEKAVKPLFEIVFDSYLLIGSDTDDFKKAIEVVLNGGRYFSVGNSKNC